MEKPVHADLFRRGLSVSELVQAIQLECKLSAGKEPWLLFLDEIQEVLLKPLLISAHLLHQLTRIGDQRAFFNRKTLRLKTRRVVAGVAVSAAKA